MARGVNVLGSGEKTLRARSYCFDTHFEKGFGLALLDSPGGAACIMALSYTGQADDCLIMSSDTHARWPPESCSARNTV